MIIFNGRSNMSDECHMTTSAYKWIESDELAST